MWCNKKFKFKIKIKFGLHQRHSEIVYNNERCIAFWQRMKPFETLNFIPNVMDIDGFLNCFNFFIRSRIYDVNESITFIYHCIGNVIFAFQLIFKGRLTGCIFFTDYQIFLGYFKPNQILDFKNDSLFLRKWLSH